MQLYLDDGQYQWLKQQAQGGGSVSGVVRDLIDMARSHAPSRDDPLIRYLLDEPSTQRFGASTVTSLDEGLYR